MNSDKLPEKWYIKQTEETYQIINDWLNTKVGQKNYYKETRSYVHYPSNYAAYTEFKKGYHSYTFPKPDYQEITFEQFKKYVLEEETVSEINNNYQIF